MCHSVARIGNTSGSPSRTTFPLFLLSLLFSFPHKDVTVRGSRFSRSSRLQLNLNSQPPLLLLAFVVNMALKRINKELTDLGR